MKKDGNIFNLAYLFRRDGTIEKQAKIHATPNERKWWGIAEGNKIHVFDTDCGKIAIQICYDIEFPELARIAVDKGQTSFLSHFVRRIVRAISVFVTVPRHERLRIKYIPVLLEPWAT